MILGIPGGLQIVLIIVVILLLFGGRKSPYASVSKASQMKEFKDATKSDEPTKEDENKK